MPKEYTLQICGHTYTVKVVKDMSPYHAEAGVSSREGLWGFHNGMVNEIIILDDLCTQRKQETLIHEVAHAMLFCSGVEHEEMLAQILANNLMQLGFGPTLWKRLQPKQ